MWKVRVARAPLAGLVLLLGLVLPARAGDLLRRCFPDCGSPCNTEVIKLPAQQITVETARPQVVVNETRVVHAKPRRVAAAPAPVMAAPLAFAPSPMVATIFTPMAMPLTAAAPVPHLAAPLACPKERTTLDALHDMERHSLEVQKLHAAHTVEMAHAKDAFKRMSLSLQSALGSGTVQANGDDDVRTELRKEVARLNGLITGISDKTTRIEGVIKELQQFALVHDEVIKNKVLQGSGSTATSSCGSASSDTKKLEAMIAELQKLVIKHDEVLRDLLARQRGIPVPGPGPMQRIPSGN
jgi:hypothetical protein